MCHLTVIKLPSKPCSDTRLLELEGELESNQTGDSQESTSCQLESHSTNSSRAHLNIHYNALEVLKHFSLRSLEVMSTKGICLLIMFL